MVVKGIRLKRVSLTIIKGKHSMGINYSRTVYWNVTIINAWLNQDGLVCSAQKTTAGAPAADVGRYVPGAIVQNLVTGLVYRMSGTTASPAWEDMQSGFTLPFSDTDSSTTIGVGFALAFSALTTGVAERTSAPLATTGILSQMIAAAAVLTTGRYYSANDGATEVWGIGANGHMHSTVSANPPTIAVTTPNGISAAAITAGGTDTCGVITTTGTQDGSGDTVLDITFGKTYTVAPKFVMLSPANAAGAKTTATTLLRAYVSARSATGFTIVIPEDTGTPLATPSFMYFVIA